MNIEQENITASAFANYSHSTPWPDNDPWHAYTRVKEKQVVEKWLKGSVNSGDIILNAGSGGTEYDIHCKATIHLDIVKEYIDQFDQYIVGSIENIPLPDKSLNGVICVGSVINYADAQRAISEFSRTLKDGGFLILEFERSESAEFLGTRNHGKAVFSKKYLYNGQEHYLWLYSEIHVLKILRYYGFRIQKKTRIHTLSSLLNRFGMPEAKSATYARFDSALRALSFSLAHNVLLFLTKDIPSKSVNGNHTCNNG